MPDVEAPLSTTDLYTLLTRWKSQKAEGRTKDDGVEVETDSVAASLAGGGYGESEKAAGSEVASLEY